MLQYYFTIYFTISLCIHLGLYDVSNATLYLNALHYER